jgi:hypothetical protein
MKLKLSHTEFSALLNLLAGVMNFRTQYFEMEDKLMFSLLAKTYGRFYKKALFKKKEYGISLPDEEALNWYLVFSDEDIYLPEQDPQLLNLIHKINNNIHQQYQN